MSKQEFKGEVLLGDSLVAFASALLLARAWQMPEENINLSFIIFTCSIPDCTGLAAILLLVALSILLAIASIISKVQHRVLSLRIGYAPLLGLLGWMGFVLGWASAIAKLPPDQWWSYILVYGGLAFVGLLFWKFLCGMWAFMRKDY